MVTEGLLPHWKETATCPYSKPDQSNRSNNYETQIAGIKEFFLMASSNSNTEIGATSSSLWVWHIHSSLWLLYNIKINAML
jgi:hypothetical protein